MVDLQLLLARRGLGALALSRRRSRGAGGGLGSARLDGRRSRRAVADAEMGVSGAGGLDVLADLDQTLSDGAGSRGGVSGGWFGAVSFGS